MEYQDNTLHIEGIELSEIEFASSHVRTFEGNYVRLISGPQPLLVFEGLPSGTERCVIPSSRIGELCNFYAHVQMNVNKLIPCMFLEMPASSIYDRLYLNKESGQPLHQMTLYPRRNDLPPVTFKCCNTYAEVLARQLFPFCEKEYRDIILNTDPNIDFGLFGGPDVLARLGDGFTVMNLDGKRENVLRYWRLSGNTLLTRGATSFPAHWRPESDSYLNFKLSMCRWLVSAIQEQVLS